MRLFGFVHQGEGLTKPNQLMDLKFMDDGWKDYGFWHKNDKRVLKRINRLIEDIQATPYSDPGKPELLKHNLSGCFDE